MREKDKQSLTKDPHNRLHKGKQDKMPLSGDLTESIKTILALSIGLAAWTGRGGGHSIFVGESRRYRRDIIRTGSSVVEHSQSDVIVIP